MEPSRILVVAAQPHVRRIVEFLMEVAGHEVRTARDGEEGWRAVTSFRPDLVLTEGCLPGLDGLVLVAGMKARFDLAGVPVIVLCGDGSPTAQLRALRAGADHVLPVPFSQDELLLRVRNLLRASRNSRRIGHLLDPAALAEGLVASSAGTARP